MPSIRKLTEAEYTIAVQNDKIARTTKTPAIEIYGVTPNNDCDCIFNAPAHLLKYSNAIYEWLVFIPHALEIDFDTFTKIFADKMPRRKYFVHNTDRGFIVGFTFARA